jgi:hypothetical protein
MYPAVNYYLVAIDWAEPGCAADAALGPVAVAVIPDRGKPRLGCVS